jgi:hypothetical protein
MQSDYAAPLNLGSDELVSIDALVDTVSRIANKPVVKRHNLKRPQAATIRVYARCWVGNQARLWPKVLYRHIAGSKHAVRATALRYLASRPNSRSLVGAECHRAS